MHVAYEVAKLLGIEIVGDAFKYPFCGEEMYCDPLGFPFMIVNFAAYARCQMASRGWDAYIHIHCLGYDLDAHRRIVERPYNPSSPMSEALAWLACTRDALAS